MRKKDTMEHDTLPEETVCSDAMEHDTLSDETVCSDAMEHDTLVEKQVCASGMYHETLVNIQSGILPETLDAAAEAIAYLAESARTAIPSMAMLLSFARREMNNVTDWVAWAEKYSGLEGDDLHHRRAIGDLLLDYRGTGHFAMLFSLDQQKLLALYRVHRTQAGALTPFLSRYPNITTMTRDQVRLAVGDWLGEGKSAKTQLLLPGFEKFFTAINSASDEAIATMVTSHAQAASAATTARKLVDAAKSYFGANSDMQELVSLKATVKSMLDELDDDIRSLPAALELQ